MRGQGAPPTVGMRPQDYYLEGGRQLHEAAALRDSGYDCLAWPIGGRACARVWGARWALGWGSLSKRGRDAGTVGASAPV